MTRIVEACAISDNRNHQPTRRVWIRHCANLIEDRTHAFERQGEYSAVLDALSDVDSPAAQPALQLCVRGGRNCRSIEQREIERVRLERILLDGEIGRASWRERGEIS